MDIREDDQAFGVTAEMPGAQPEDVEVIVEDDVLTIRAERTQARSHRTDVLKTSLSDEQESRLRQALEGIARPAPVAA